MNDCYKLILPLKGGVKTSYFIPLVKIKSSVQNKENNKEMTINNEKNRFFFFLMKLIFIF